MTISHHPGEALLLDYASGALGEGWSLAIAAHLALCPDCRRLQADMEAIGGALLEETPRPSASSLSFDDVLSRLEETEDEVARPVAGPANGSTPILPEPLRGYLGGDLNAVEWQRLGLGAYQALIPTSDATTTARLLRIPAGRPVPVHSHGGLELTLVLDGLFSDATGSYGRGDLQEADEMLQHQPHAGAEKDCICLAVTDAPLRFKSLAARLAQPLLGI
jgi:putative transcriptional regulator